MNQDQHDCRPASPDPMLDRYRGSLLGGALGDAMGRPTEFDDKPNAGLEHIDLPRPALVTDDTQMSLIVAQALNGTTRDLEHRLAEALGRWRTEADHVDRAPGTTCLTATEALAAHVPWPAAAVADSKGCGGVMRAHPCAFVLPASSSDLGGAVGVLQSAMTHGHPTAHVAAAAWVAVVRAAALGEEPGTWLGTAGRVVETPLPVPVEMRTVLGGAQTLALGAQEMREALDSTAAGLRGWNLIDDPCSWTGEGWTAEEAVATALLVALTYANDPQDAVRRAARTCGDSDTLSSMVGALLGARHGTSAWPPDWVEVLEEPYRTDSLDAQIPILRA